MRRVHFRDDSGISAFCREVGNGTGYVYVRPPWVILWDSTENIGRNHIEVVWAMNDEVGDADYKGSGYSSSERG